METLSSRLESVQDALLTLYEQDSNRLDDQIKQWTLVKEENVLLHAARKKGITRLGMHMVPTLQSSEARARDAIEMELYLKSLRQSPYGTEPWNLAQTTRERFLAAPPYCFKKDGSNVDVYYDNDKDNSVRYITWGAIYYQNGNDDWHKVQGRIEHDGLYYVQHDGLKVTYVDFAAEASAYSRTGSWRVVYNNKTVLPDNSVASSRSGRQRTSSPTGPGAEYSPRSTTPTDTVVATPLKASKKDTAAGVRRGTRHHNGAGRRGGGRRVQQRKSDPKRGAAITPPSPSEVGGRHQTPQRRSGSRLQRLLQEARDPPAVLLKGQANTLKCFRFQAKAKFAGQFRSVSTTFYWTASEGTDRVGRARVIFLFTDKGQRERFMSRVKFPPSIETVLLNMDGF
ncbi:putative E2 early protein [Rhinolophus ferrumequinum papillomavirus 1]|uniref:Regulatory protein E2 n=1 Tax=Rhinolophus ferrumequinum papillomavirus 1 TaxID=1464074 RepID=W8EC70_9PAPI|nr:putative E2 early protein [Rhinolophus ferrumequinum papillomavirus 1]AHJ81405.1 putative E2 early protein [Rhinolophus ferrumequinum papillomavirus 1]